MKRSPQSDQLSLANIQRAELTAQHVERALTTPTNLVHLLRSQVVLANRAQHALTRFTVDWIDKTINQLQALRNLGNSLATSACESRDQLTIALGGALEYRMEDAQDKSFVDADLDDFC